MTHKMIGWTNRFSAEWFVTKTMFAAKERTLRLRAWRVSVDFSTTLYPKRPVVVTVGLKRADGSD